MRAKNLDKVFIEYTRCLKLRKSCKKLQLCKLYVSTNTNIVDTDVYPKSDGCDSSSSSSTFAVLIRTSLLFRVVRVTAVFAAAKSLKKNDAKN